MARLDGRRRGLFPGGAKAYLSDTEEGLARLDVRGRGTAWACVQAGQCRTCSAHMRCEIRGQIGPTWATQTGAPITSTRTRSARHVGAKQGIDMGLDKD